MATLEDIHTAQDQLSDLQSQLDDVQSILDAAERLSAAGERAKQRAQQLLVLSAVLVGVGVLLLVWGGRKKTAG